MSFNENIKYCRKPIFNDFTDVSDIKEERRWMSCISQISSACYKKIYTTKEKRICAHCMEDVRFRNQGSLK